MGTIKSSALALVIHVSLVLILGVYHNGLGQWCLSRCSLFLSELSLVEEVGNNLISISTSPRHVESGNLPTSMMAMRTNANVEGNPRGNRGPIV